MLLNKPPLTLALCLVIGMAVNAQNSSGLEKAIFLSVNCFYMPLSFGFGKSLYNFLFHRFKCVDLVRVVGTKKVLLLILTAISFQFSFAQTWSAGSGSSIYYNNGNVGIGTISPSALLHLFKSSGDNLLRVESGNAAYSYLSLKNSAAEWQMLNNSDGSFGITNPSTERFHISSNGNVGIGTTSPTRPLNVVGSSLFESNNINASIRMKPSSSSFNGGNLVVDFSENYDIGNSAVGVIGIANTTWAAPVPSFAIVSAKNGTGSAKDIMFWANDAPSSSNVAMTIKANSGNVAIGTPNDHGYKLAINGNVLAQKIRITQTGWPDYVFHPSYKLFPLKDLEKYIKSNNHLPGVPSATDVEKNGLDLGENQATLLKKIEELTLYIIEQDKKIESLQIHNKRLLELEKNIEVINAQLQTQNQFE